MRAVPTPAAWELGRRSADLLAERYFQDEGEWPRAIALTVWGTSNMRTGGDDIAQALALIGARPVWEGASGRVTGFEVMPLSELKRPRVDVTLRISGFFRDAFPSQIALFHEAVQAVAERDEPADANPIARAHPRRRERLGGGGHGAERSATARRRFRIFGSKPGAYGAGLQALIDEGIWAERKDLAAAFLEWSAYAYGGGAEGEGARDLLEDAAEGDRRGGAEPGQSRARSARFRRLLPVRGRARGLGARRCAARRRASSTTTIRGPSGR